VQTEHSGEVASIAAWSTRKERKANAANDENVLRTETRKKKALIGPAGTPRPRSQAGSCW
jgi:hypothetical protein